MAAGFKEFLERSKALPVNEVIAEGYVSFLSSKDVPQEKSRIDYCRMILLFLESLDKELPQLTVGDIVNYKKQKGLSDNRFNAFLTCIVDLVDFCNIESLVVNITKDDVLNLRVRQSTIQETNPSKILGPREIVAIRQALIEKEDIRKLLTFELLYGFGLRERELINFTFENYNEKDGSFVYNGKPIFLPEYLREIIKDASEEVRAKYSTYGGKDITNFKNHIVVAGELVNIKLKISDLTETHNKTSIRCPNPECERTFPFEEQYWALQPEGDEPFQFYFPLCMCCAKERGWNG